MHHHSRNLSACPDPAELRRRFPDLSVVTVTMVRRTFHTSANFARQALILAKQKAHQEAQQAATLPPNVAALMQEHGLSESEAVWALANPDAWR